MENDESPDWPAEGYSEGEGADLGGSDDPGLEDHDLAYHDVDGGEPDSGREPDGGHDPDDSADVPGGSEFDDAGYDVDGPELGHDQDDDPQLDTDAHDGVPGTDPDVDPMTDDDAWHADPFPETLDLDQPEPVDGMPWSDPALLGDSGGEPLGDPGAPHGDGTPPIAELYEYDGGQPPADGSDPWQSLSGSEDPATSSLARFWAPN
jgi:hypothetical protein